MTERKATFELLSEENDMTTNYRLEIERLDGAWDIMMREIDSQQITRGTGNSFEAAWSAMGPTQR